MQVLVDATMAGDVKLAGDIDKDGRPDLVMGGNLNEGARWYKFPSLVGTRFAVPIEQFSLEGALVDVDRDGDLDFVVGDGRIADNVVWLENPLPAAPASRPVWARHVIGQAGGWVMGLVAGDFDRNGLQDVVVLAGGPRLVAFFRLWNGGWQKVAFGTLPLPTEGLASGDIDRNRTMDLVLRGAWLGNPGGTAARIPARWALHVFGSAPRSMQALVCDINRDGRTDIVYSSAEGTADVRWWKSVTADPAGTWTSRLVWPALNRAHTLQCGDVDGDGDTDLLVAQLHISPEKRVMILYNMNRIGTSWAYQTIATEGLHRSLLVDVDGDGDLDVFGANFTGNPPVRVWLNQLRQPVPQ